MTQFLLYAGIFVLGLAAGFLLGIKAMLWLRDEGVLTITYHKLEEQD